ncbi:hypothetical protein MMC07_002747 [Pseudocyphellaria aurata]|nr:hypothetical protein [Pseudocyphellaria aurata]
MSTVEPQTVKTRFCILSDTHSQPPLPESSTDHAYRQPLPAAHVLLHAGDLTMTGRVSEYQQMLNTFRHADAELKIVIAGNHDITLDESFYGEIGGSLFHLGKQEDVTKVREMWTGWEAKQAGIVYLEEGTRTFHLRNGAKFTIYTSPYQPAYETWAFNYQRSTDRFNPGATAPNPVPSWPEIDIMLTHGPPYNVLDTTWQDEQVGCEHLARAVQRCRPRLHCFGHIHEGWGAERANWAKQSIEEIEIDRASVSAQRSSYLDLSESGSALKFGEETLFVNAAIMNKRYRPSNAPWVVDLDLPFVATAKVHSMLDV